jgi:hypothetical protein
MPINWERLILVSLISAHFAPEIAALGLPPDQREQAIGEIALTMVGFYHAVAHYGVLYLKRFLKSKNIPLPEDLDKNPTAPPPAANS